MRYYSLGTRRMVEPAAGTNAGLQHTDGNLSASRLLSLVLDSRKTLASDSCLSHE